MENILADMRAKQGLRLEDIAEQIGVAISTVQRWEKGAMAIPSSRLDSVARAYKCAVSDIFSSKTPDVIPEQSEIIDLMSRASLTQRKQAVAVVRAMLKSATDE